MAEPVTQFSLERVDSVALVTMDDGTGKGRPNVFSRAALESLAELLPELEEGDLKRHNITLVDIDRFVDLWIEYYPKLSDSARRRFPLQPIYFLGPIS